MNRSTAFTIALTVLVSCPACASGGELLAMKSPTTRSYEVSIPKGWERHLSVGKFTVIGEPFYGIRSKSFGLCPVLRVRWSLENLSAEPLYLKVNYRGKRPTGPGGTGYGMGYVLPAHQRRTIEDVVPVFSAKVAAPLKVYLVKLWTPNGKLDPIRRHLGVTIGLLKAAGPLTDDLAARNERNARFVVKQVRLTRGGTEGNVLEATVRNDTDGELPLGVHVAVSDPAQADHAMTASPMMRSRGTFAEATAMVRPHSDATVRVPYSVASDVGPDPLLAFRLYEPTETLAPAVMKRLGLTERELRAFRNTQLVHWGRFDLRKAADKGLASLPAQVAVEQRAKLTAERRSKHFVFRYRPHSYAARHIEKAVNDREMAYDKLRAVLRMQPPVTVRIDLYPDTAAKALGSGTKWTPANTVNNRHIAEVYNQAYQCDSYHELAHIFSFHFGGGGGGLCEAFAVYFEKDRASVDRHTQTVASKLRKGKLPPLGDILRAKGTTNGQVLFVHYLLTRDLAKFKKFYAANTHGKGTEEMEKVSREIYGVGMQGLEQQWRDWLTKQ